MRQRILVVLGVSLVVALAVVSIRSCTDSFNRPYNQGYRPMDGKRAQQPGVNP